MPLLDPVAIYNATSNIEAKFLQDALDAAGVESCFFQDDSGEAFVGDLVAATHKIQVMVERKAVPEAKAVVRDFERRSAELRQVDESDEVQGVTIEAACEECRARSPFPAAQRGSVQRCPKCGAYMDVGDE